jgi:hypothetical protein
MSFMTLRARFWAAAILASVGIVTAFAGGDAERSLSITQAIEIADGAIGYPQGRPESYEVVTAKLFFMKSQDLIAEGIPGGHESVQSLLSGRRYWLVQYRRWPIRLDGGLAVFVDAETGKVLTVARDRR